MSLFPFAGDNSIQNVVFALEWADELTSSEVAAILALHSDPRGTVLRKAFPIVQAQQMVMINVNAETGVQSAGGSGKELGGVNFVRPSLTGLGTPSRAINLSKLNCLGVVGEYSRWASVWPEVNDWFATLVPLIVKGRAINTIGLQYTDVFHWKADPSTLDLRKVFSESGAYLPKNAFHAPSLWHSHHGFFEQRHAESVQHDLLQNINVNVVDNAGALSIQIITSHKAHLKTPIWQAASVMEALGSLMPDLHMRNKEILNDLLVEDVKQTIKLTTK